MNWTDCHRNGALNDREPANRFNRLLKAMASGEALPGDKRSEASTAVKYCTARDDDTAAKSAHAPKN